MGINEDAIVIAVYKMFDELNRRVRKAGDCDELIVTADTIRLVHDLCIAAGYPNAWAALNAGLVARATALILENAEFLRDLRRKNDRTRAGTEAEIRKLTAFIAARQ